MWKAVKANIASYTKKLWSEACAACNVTLANAVQESEAVAELHCSAVKEVWDKDNGATIETTKTIHQDNDNDNV